MVCSSTLCSLSDQLNTIENWIVAEIHNIVLLPHVRVNLHIIKLKAKKKTIYVFNVQSNCLSEFNLFIIREFIIIFEIVIFYILYEYLMLIICIQI